MSTTFKTESGLTLQLINLKGKMYLPVQQRVLWFRHEKPTWTIESELVTYNDKMCLAKATIKDEAGKIVSNDFKLETTSDFKDHIEKSVTGAIGRALALCGYGTQYAVELDEGDDVCDGPVQTQPAAQKQKPANDFPPFDDEPPFPGEEFSQSATPQEDQSIRVLVKNQTNIPTGVYKLGIPESVAKRLAESSDAAKLNEVMGWVIPYGKNKGMKIGDMEPGKRWSHAKWIKENIADPKEAHLKFMEFHNFLEKFENENK